MIRKLIPFNRRRSDPEKARGTKRRKGIDALTPEEKRRKGLDLEMYDEDKDDEEMLEVFRELISEKRKREKGTD